jgi:hypothetical protein
VHFFNMEPIVKYSREVRGWLREEQWAAKNTPE